MLSISEAESRAASLVESARKAGCGRRRRSLYRRCLDQHRGAAGRARGCPALGRRGDRASHLLRPPVGHGLFVGPVARRPRCAGRSLHRHGARSARRSLCRAGAARAAGERPRTERRRRRRGRSSPVELKDCALAMEDGGARRRGHHQQRGCRGKRRPLGDRARHQRRLLPRLHDERLQPLCQRHRRLGRRHAARFGDRTAPATSPISIRRSGSDCWPPSGPSSGSTRPSSRAGRCRWCSIRGWEPAWSAI